MTAREYKARLASGDKLSVTMHALMEVDNGNRKYPPYIWAQFGQDGRDEYERGAKHILAAQAKAERLQGGGKAKPTKRT